VVRGLVEASPKRSVSIDAVANALKARGFQRPPGSPRLVTRLRRIRELLVSPSGTITLAEDGVAAREEPRFDHPPRVEPLPVVESGPTDEAETDDDRQPDFLRGPDPDLEQPEVDGNRAESSSQPAPARGRRRRRRRWRGGQRQPAPGPRPA
jgi:hypothetical protein